MGRLFFGCAIHFTISRWPRPSDIRGAKILRLRLTNYKLREGKQPTHLNSYKATLDEELRKIAEDLEVVIKSLTQRDPVELPLVDVGDLVVVPADRRTRGRLKDVPATINDVRAL